MAAVKCIFGITSSQKRMYIRLISSFRDSRRLDRELLLPDSKRNVTLQDSKKGQVALRHLTSSPDRNHIARRLSVRAVPRPRLGQLPPFLEQVATLVRAHHRI